MTRASTLAGFAVLAVAAMLCELVARSWRGLPTLAEVLRVATRRPGLRWLFVGAWLWLGWHLFVRVDWR